MRHPHLATILELCCAFGALTGCAAAPPSGGDPMAASASEPSPSAAPEASGAPVAYPPAPPRPSVPARKIVLDEGGGCALLADGGVSCWGGTKHARPRRLEGVGDVKDLSLGGDLAIVRNDGSVLLFRGGDVTRKPDTLGVTGVESLSQRHGSACALTTSGKVLCWPEGLRADDGKLRPAHELAGLGEVKAVSTSNRRACVLRGDGRVGCFTLGSKKPNVRLVPGLEKAVELQVGPEVGCARDAAKRVSCFWVEEPKELVAVGEADAFTWSAGPGDSPIVCRANGAQIECKRPERWAGSYTIPSMDEGTIAGARPVVQLAAAKQAACALDDAGTVRCWGLNIGGVLGEPDTRYVETPTVVPGLPKARSVVAGDRFTCSLSTAGDVHCWGQSKGSPALDKAPLVAEPRRIGVDAPEELVASNEYACAFSKRREATCFYGLETTLGPHVPARIPALDGAKSVRLPDLGFANAVAAIDAEGRVRVGPSAGFDTLEGLALEPVKGLESAELLTSISMGLFGSPGVYGYAIARLANGKVYSATVGEGPARPPVQLRGLDGALALQDGGLALLPGGKIASARLHEPAALVAASSPLVSLVDGGRPCGMTADGRFGCVEDGDFRVLFDEPRSVAGGGGHWCEVDARGDVRCLGNNDWGQCGVTVGVFASAEPLTLRFE